MLIDTLSHAGRNAHGNVHIDPLLIWPGNRQYTAACLRKPGHLQVDTRPPARDHSTTCTWQMVTCTWKHGHMKMKDGQVHMYTQCGSCNAVRNCRLASVINSHPHCWQSHVDNLWNSAWTLCEVGPYRPTIGGWRATLLLDFHVALLTVQDKRELSRYSETFCGCRS